MIRIRCDGKGRWFRRCNRRFRRPTLSPVRRAPVLPILDRRSSHEELEQRLLAVEPVLGLIEDDRRVGLEHFSGHFLAAMGRETVHEERAGLGERHQLIVDLEGGEDAAPQD